MTIKTIQKRSSEVALEEIRDEASSLKSTSALTSAMIEAWSSLPSSVRAALVQSEIISSSDGFTNQDSNSSSGSSTHSSTASDVSSKEKTSEIQEVCPETGAKIILKPLERASENVFSFTKTWKKEQVNVEKNSVSTVTTKTTVVSKSRGWRNVFTLPISYDLTVVPHGTLFDTTNHILLESTGVHGSDYMRRFAVIDNVVNEIYGNKIREYFASFGIELHTLIIDGGEPAKRPEAVDLILDHMCEYKLRRREPFLAIGGGCVLDICGMAACLYRRGVPFVRVPTTLLALVDASVGVKNGVDYCCGRTQDTYKNRVGSFYAPSSCLLDASFISSQKERDIANGFGEIVKLALVRSPDLFELLETYGPALIQARFERSPLVPECVGGRIIDLSIQIMLEELGPNLWEYDLERCVDYGHTFSKLLEMIPNLDVMHGEAVNIDGFFCCILSHIRGYITIDMVNRIFKCMKSMSLPTHSPHLNAELAWQSCQDAIEHRNGQMRVPLITDIGESICVSDITLEELKRALEVMDTFPHYM